VLDLAATGAGEVALEQQLEFDQQRELLTTPELLLREIVESSDWEAYGRGRRPRCANCMAHCGYEPTAMLATTRSVRQSLRAFLS
jgi:hypothetical protein